MILLNAILIIASILLAVCMYFVLDVIIPGAPYWIEDWANHHCQILAYFHLRASDFDDIELGNDFYESELSFFPIGCWTFLEIMSFDLLGIFSVWSLIFSFIHVPIPGFTRIFVNSFALFVFFDALIVAFALFKLARYVHLHQISNLGVFLDFYVPQGFSIGDLFGLASTEQDLAPVCRMLRMQGADLSLCLATINKNQNLIARVKLANKILNRKNAVELVNNNSALKVELANVANDFKSQIQVGLDVVAQYKENYNKRQGDILVKRLRGLK